MTYQPNSFRPYTSEDVNRIRGSFQIEHTLAKLGAERLWKLFNEKPYVKALGAYTGMQAVQMVRAGLDAIYLSGWQVAGETTNTYGDVFPDQSIYPVNSVPNVVKAINNALLRADQVETAEGGAKRYWLAPIVADLEAGFGGPLNAFQLAKSAIECGASAIHLEDQLASEKKCGHMSGRVLVPTKTFIKQLVAAKLASDVCNTSTVLVARTDAESATFITSDADEYDDPFIDKANRSDDGFYRLTGKPIERCIARGLAYAPYADMLWMETSKADLDEAAAFAQGIHEKFPGKLLAYNCSPSFNWKKNLSDAEIESFQDKLGELGFRFQFITLASWHTNNFSAYKLAHEYKDRGMSAYVDVQEDEFAWQSKGYTAVKHQREVGTGFFDTVRQIIDGNNTMSALSHSTEAQQFTGDK